MRKDDVGCRIGVLAICSSSMTVDRMRKKKKRAVNTGGSLRAEMVDIVHMEMTTLMKSVTVTMCWGSGQR